MKSNLTKMFLRSSIDFSRSLKHLAFCSLHMLHINHNWHILHAAKRLSTWPRLQSNNSITFLGITHSTPKRLNIVLHNSLATSQWRKRWSIDFPVLYMQHHFTTITPKSESYQESLSTQKKTHPQRNIDFPNALPRKRWTLTYQKKGKDELLELDDLWKMISLQTSSSLKGSTKYNPHYFVSIWGNAINQKRNHQIYLPILYISYKDTFH